MAGAIDLAQLAITVKFDDVGRATVALDRLTAAGDRSQKSSDGLGDSHKKTGDKITDSSRAMTLAQVRAIEMDKAMFGAAKRITDSSRAMTLMQERAIAMDAAMNAPVKHMGAWATLQAQAAGHTGNHSLAIGRLERALAGIVGHFLGANAAQELLASGMLKFTAGTLETAGILAGLALLVGLYEKITEGAREAKKKMDDMTNSLVEQARAAREATVAGRADLSMIAEVNQQTVQKESGIGWRSVVGTVLTGRPFLAGHDTDAQETRLANAATAVDQAHANEAKARQEVAEEAARKAEEAARKAHTAAEKLAHLREQVAEWDGKQAGLWKEQLARIVEWYGTIKNYTATSPFKFESEDFKMPTTGVNVGLTHHQIVQRRKMGIGLEEDGIGGAVQGALSQFSPSNLAAGAVSSLLGSAISGFTSMLGDLLGGGKAAAEAFKKAVEQLKASQDAFHASATGNTLESALLSQQASYQQQLAQINALYPHLALEKDAYKNSRQSALDKAAADEAIAEERIRKAHAHDEQYATEDLAVRNLKALGRGDAADLLAFREKQEREMQAAKDSLKDELYRNNLATTLNNELLAFQNGLLSSALRNAPSGWFGVGSYLSDYVTPRGPMNTDGGSVSGGGRDNSNGGLNAGSGKGAQTIILQVDGRVLTRVVVGGLDQHGAATGGAGSSRSRALDTYPA